MDHLRPIKDVLVYGCEASESREVRRQAHKLALDKSDSDAGSFELDVEEMVAPYARELDKEQRHRKQQARNLFFFSSIRLCTTQLRLVVEACLIISSGFFCRHFLHLILDFFGYVGKEPFLEFRAAFRFELAMSMYSLIVVSSPRWGQGNQLLKISLSKISSMPGTSEKVQDSAFGHLCLWVVHVNATEVSGILQFPELLDAVSAITAAPLKQLDKQTT
jgi:hypothetical protein